MFKRNGCSADKKNIVETLRKKDTGNVSKMHRSMFSLEKIAEKYPETLQRNFDREYDLFIVNKTRFFEDLDFK